MELESARNLFERRGSRELGGLIRHVDQTPPGHVVKGMYLAGIWQALGEANVNLAERPRIHSFKDYPMRTYLDLLLDAAVSLHPRELPSEGLRRLGHLAIPTFASSMVGGVMLGAAGANWERILNLVSKGYDVSLKPGSARVRPEGDHVAVVELREVWSFGDSYQVGVMEGLMSWANVKGHVSAESSSPCDHDLRLDWQPP